MTIKDIYKKYQIPPNLQLHMFRVAAIAKLIANTWTGSMIDIEVITEACLLHDLGNILKFDFDNFPHLLGEEQKNIEYWKEVKNSMLAKYGLDEDIATVQMINELNVNSKVKFIVENWGFKNFHRINESNNLEWKICVYADHRISPNGVTTLDENLANKRKRYAFNKTNASHLSQESESLLEAAKNIEKYIAANCSIDLAKISDENVNSQIIGLGETDI